MKLQTLGGITLAVVLLFLAALVLAVAPGTRTRVTSQTPSMGRAPEAQPVETVESRLPMRSGETLLSVLEAPSSPHTTPQPPRQKQANEEKKGKQTMATETATFGAGCFWGVEATFRQTPGVLETAVGYAGGTMKNPTYEDICTDRTGHAEVVEVKYDPDKVRYEDLLKIFFENHNPTTRNRQGPDVGSQYRSAVFYHSDAQRQAAEKMKADLDATGKFRSPIVTEITPASTFYRAEEYHQRYLEKRGLASCHL